MNHKKINDWMKKNISAKNDEELFGKDKLEDNFGEELKFLRSLRTWNDLKRAYRKTAKVYSLGIISTKQVQTILALLNSYSEIIEKKELNSLKEDYLELLEKYKNLEEVVKNDFKR